MTAATIQQALEAALAHLQSGNFRDAETLLRQVLALQPDHADALHFLGILASRTGHYDHAIGLIARAIAIQPAAADYYVSLGAAFIGAGRRPDAIAAYQQALRLDVSHLDALNLLASAHQESANFTAAIETFQRCLVLHPQAAEVHYNLGNALQADGRHAAAMDAYRQALALGYHHPQVYNNLGIALRAAGELGPAIENFQQALQLHPMFPDAFSNLALALSMAGRLEEAVSAYSAALNLRPEFVDLYRPLAITLRALGRPQEAIPVYQQALTIHPRHPASLKGLADSHFEMEQWDLALKAYQRAADNAPHIPENHFDVGTALQKTGDYPAAIQSFRKALEIRAEYPEALANLGNALLENGEIDEAITQTRKALELHPDFALAHYNLGSFLRMRADPDGACASLSRALELQPNYPDAINNLGNLLHDTGQVHAAIQAYERTLALDPDYYAAASNRIYSMHFHPDYDAPAIAAALADWNQRFATPRASVIQPHQNNRDPDRRLRIGYVSPDFREHVVGWNLLPLLSRHDHQQFQIYCYSSVKRPDAMTEKLKSHADVWRDLAGLKDQRAAEIIREDQIDILVDLSLHSAGHRLLLFAQKPAPIQLTYLGYPGSTGLTTIDYRFSDPHLDSKDQEQLYAERTIRLPQTYWCYQPGAAAPESGSLPAASNGFITFGCLNNFAKVSDQALQLWANILQSLPQSRLLLHAQPGSHRARVLEKLAIDSHRIEFIPRQPVETYLQIYQRIDIALDPFPYSGGITTCDALYMGVPVITLAGQTAVGRTGKSILSNLRLTELVAQSADQYQQIASSLGHDIPRLTSLRATLRQRMQSSPLMDPARFATDVQAAYRNIWRRWCESPPNVDDSPQDAPALATDASSD